MSIKGFTQAQCVCTLQSARVHLDARVFAIWQEAFVSGVPRQREIKAIGIPRKPLRTSFCNLLKAAESTCGVTFDG